MGRFSRALCAAGGSAPAVNFLIAALLVSLVAGSARAQATPARGTAHGRRHSLVAGPDDGRRGRARQRAAAAELSPGFRAGCDAPSAHHARAAVCANARFAGGVCRGGARDGAPRPIGWELEATGYFNVVFAAHAVGGDRRAPTAEMRELQQEVVDAVAPYTEPKGTAAAFVTSSAEPGINLSTIEYVDTFVPQQIGEKYHPHVTIGVGQKAFVEKLKAAPFPTFKFKMAGAAVFHLGNFGTAAKELWAWPPERSGWCGWCGGCE